MVRAEVSGRAWSAGPSGLARLFNVHVIMVACFVTLPRRGHGPTSLARSAIAVVRMTPENLKLCQKFNFMYMSVFDFYVYCSTHLEIRCHQSTSTAQTFYGLLLEIPEFFVYNVVVSASALSGFSFDSATSEASC